MNKVFPLCLLAVALFWQPSTPSVHAGPQLTIGVTNEIPTPFPDFISGLTGLGRLNSFSVWPVQENQWMILQGAMRPGLGPDRRMMWFNLLVANTGDEPWDPFNFPLVMGTWRYLALGAYAEAKVVHPTTGHILSSRLIESPWAHDLFPIDGSASLGYRYGRFGLSPGWAGWSQELIEVTGLTNGEYILQVAVDPINLWNQYTEVAVRFTITNYDARLPVAASTPIDGVSNVAAATFDPAVTPETPEKRFGFLAEPGPGQCFINVAAATCDALRPRKGPQAPRPNGTPRRADGWVHGRA